MALPVQVLFLLQVLVCSCLDFPKATVWLDDLIQLVEAPLAVLKPHEIDEHAVSAALIACLGWALAPASVAVGGKEQKRWTLLHCSASFLQCLCCFRVAFSSCVSSKVLWFRTRQIGARATNLNFRLVALAPVFRVLCGPGF